MRDDGFRSFVDQVKAAVDIRQIIGEKIPLDAASRGKCPFHDDHDTSLSVNVEGKYFYCSSCGLGRDVIDFVMKFEGKSFKRAVIDLALRAGVKIPDFFYRKGINGNR